MRQAKIMQHIMKAYPECIPVEGKSIPIMGFTLQTSGDGAQNNHEMTTGDDGRYGHENASGR